MATIEGTEEDEAVSRSYPRHRGDSEEPDKLGARGKIRALKRSYRSARRIFVFKLLLFLAVTFVSAVADPNDRGAEHPQKTPEEMEQVTSSKLWAKAFVDAVEDGNWKQLLGLVRVWGKIRGIPGEDYAVATGFVFGKQLPAIAATAPDVVWKEIESFWSTTIPGWSGLLYLKDTESIWTNPRAAQRLAALFSKAKPDTTPFPGNEVALMARNLDRLAFCGAIDPATVQMFLNHVTEKGFARTLEGPLADAMARHTGTPKTTGMQVWLRRTSDQSIEVSWSLAGSREGLEPVPPALADFTAKLEVSGGGTTGPLRLLETFDGGWAGRKEIRFEGAISTWRVNLRWKTKNGEIEQLFPDAMSTSRPPPGMRYVTVPVIHPGTDANAAASRSLSPFPVEDSTRVVLPASGETELFRVPVVAGDRISGKFLMRRDPELMISYRFFCQCVDAKGARLGKPSEMSTIHSQEGKRWFDAGSNLGHEVPEDAAAWVISVRNEAKVPAALWYTPLRVERLTTVEPPEGFRLAAAGLKNVNPMAVDPENGTLLIGCWQESWLVGCRWVEPGGLPGPRQPAKMLPPKILLGHQNFTLRANGRNRFLMSQSNLEHLKFIRIDTSNGNWTPLALPTVPPPRDPPSDMNSFVTGWVVSPDGGHFAVVVGSERALWFKVGNEALVLLRDLRVPEPVCRFTDDSSELVVWSQEGLQRFNTGQVEADPILVPYPFMGPPVPRYRNDDLRCEERSPLGFVVPVFSNGAHKVALGGISRYYLASNLVWGWHDSGMLFEIDRKILPTW